jgi:hypothetical protein
VRKQQELERLLSIAQEQSQRSHAKEYWEGIEDTLQWVMGEANPAIEAWMEAKRPNTWQR